MPRPVHFLSRGERSKLQDNIFGTLAIGSTILAEVQHGRLTVSSNSLHGTCKPNTREVRILESNRDTQRTTQMHKPSRESHQGVANVNLELIFWIQPWKTKNARITSERRRPRRNISGPGPRVARGPEPDRTYQTTIYPPTDQSLIFPFSQIVFWAPANIPLKDRHSVLTELLLPGT